jgi:hypothetical protein
VLRKKVTTAFNSWCEGTTRTGTIFCCEFPVCVRHFIKKEFLLSSEIFPAPPVGVAFRKTESRLCFDPAAGFARLHDF